MSWKWLFLLVPILLIVSIPYVASTPLAKAYIVKLIEGDLLELGGKADGQSGKRVQQVWRDVRATLETKCKSYTLDMLMTKGPGEMYYI